MKIWKNLKWLFNNPPTGITRGAAIGNKCDYCGRKSNDGNLWHYEGIYTICEYCRKKVFDKVLLDKEKQNENSDGQTGM